MAEETKSNSFNFEDIGTNFASYFVKRWYLFILALILIGAIVFSISIRIWDPWVLYGMFYDTSKVKGNSFFAYSKLQKDAGDLIDELSVFHNPSNVDPNKMHEFISKASETDINKYVTVFTKAIDASKELGLEVPEALLAHYYLGYLYYIGKAGKEEERYDKAREHFLAIKQRSNFIYSEYAMMYTAFTYENQKRYKEAVNTYKEFLNVYPKSTLTVLIKYYMGRAYEMMGDFKQALTIYEDLGEEFTMGDLAFNEVMVQDFQDRVSFATRRAKISNALSEKDKPTFFKLEKPATEEVPDLDLQESSALADDIPLESDPTVAAQKIDEMMKTIEMEVPNKQPGTDTAQPAPKEKPADAAGTTKDPKNAKANDKAYDAKATPPNTKATTTKPTAPLKDAKPAAENKPNTTK